MKGGALAGHADRPVRVDTWHGRQAVVKDYRRGGARAVESSMTVLWHSPFGRTRRPPGLPEPLALEGPFLVMERIDGPAAGSRGELGATVAVTDAAATLLADLHGSLAEVARKRSGKGIVRSLERKLRELEAPRVQLRFAKALAALDERALDGELVVGHGDFSPRNILLARDGPRLIDFDRCQMAPRERDMSYWGAWAWATLALAGRQPDWTIGDRLASEYASAAGQADSTRASRAAHRAAALLRITHGWSALRARPDVAEVIAGEALRLART